ncbi:MAG: helix-turn-helix domain-containing protein [Clostridia bacterium]|nr:helix-turn-helix domain-containing protein [Clostridia bacterium]
MSLPRIISIETPVQIGNINTYFYLNEKLYSCGEECISVPHNHGKSYELRFVASGSGNQIINDKKIDLETGDWILIHPHEMHYQLEQSVTNALCIYSIRFSLKKPNNQATVVQKNAYTNILEILKTIRIVKDTELKSLVTWEQIKNEILTQQYGNFVFLKALCTMLFIQFLRLSDQKSPSLFSADDLKHNLFWREQIDRLLRYHYMEPLKLQDFADAMNISSRQTSRLFVREFGMPFVQKLMETRIEQAKIQLQYSDKTLHKVSSDCGFQNYNHFNNCFRKKIGMTPDKYRTYSRDQKQNTETKNST